MANKYFKAVVDNAISFINKATSELHNENLNTNERLKYSTINLYEGIELLLKSILINEHWTLILPDPEIEKCNTQKYENGNFRSIGYDKLIIRLENCCNISIEGKAKESFETLRDLRNKFVHFHCNDSEMAIRNAQYKSWHHLFLFIRKQETIFGTTSINTFRRIEERMLENKEFVNKRFIVISDKLKQIKNKAISVYTCLYCDKESIYLNEKDVKWNCLVCDREYTPEEISRHIYKIEYHPKHNPDFQLGICDECDNETVIPEESMGDKKDEGKYLCLGCGALWDDSDEKLCSCCGRLFFGAKLEAGICKDCFDYHITNPNS